MINVSIDIGTCGMANAGHWPDKLAKSPTLVTSRSKKITNRLMPAIAAKGAGIIFVSRGVTQINAMVKATRPRVVYNSAPLTHVFSPDAEMDLNCSNWARPITIARPLTNPSITGCGTMRINLPQRKKPAINCKTPIKTTVAKRYSTPCWLTSETITTASAPVAPEIIPGRPPIKAVIKPTKNAA